jgi:hypothetical protein
MVALTLEERQVELRPGYYAVASSLGRPACWYGQAPDLASALKIARAVIDLGLEEAPIVYRVAGNNNGSKANG